MFYLPDDLRESFEEWASKTVTHTDIDKAAYVVNRGQKKVLDAASIEPGIYPNTTNIQLHILFSDQTLKASYYGSIREGSGRAAEYRMGQFVNWLNVGDEILFATDGRDVFIYKIPSSDTGVDADIRSYDTARKDLQSQEIEEHGVAREGKPKEYYGIRYERSSKNRAAAIKIHGLVCNVCGFDFEARYGERGKGYIEVHHINPISLRGGKEVIVDPKADLMTVCSNCHRIIHRDSKNVMSIEELHSVVSRPQYK